MQIGRDVLRRTEDMSPEFLRLPLVWPHFSYGKMHGRQSDNHRGSTGPAEPLLRTPTTTNMAAANFVVITNGEGCALTGTADIDQ